MDNNNKEYNDELDKLVLKVVNLLEYKINTDDLEKQVFGGFIFGIMNALVQDIAVDPVVVHSSLLDQLILVMKFDTDEASQFAEFLIHSTDKAFHPTMNIIIHRGINAYYDLKNDDLDAVKDNYIEIMKSVGME